jgi:multiple sugar transport system permease protein
VLLYLFLILVLVFTVFPLVYAFFGSFKNDIEFLAGGANILPQHWDYKNYTYAWKEANFARYTYNSFFISIMTVVLTVLITGMAGYVLARAKFKLKQPIIALMGLVMFIPSVVLIFPIFQVCQKIGLLGNLWSMVITQTSSGLPFSVILATSYMNGISKEIDESAKIDGCSFFRIFSSIILPLSKPILATTALIAFKNAWNSYLMPLALSLSKPEIRPLTVGVISLKDTGEGISSWNIMIAGSVLAIVPMVIVYLFMNRYFIEGMTAGSVKG